MEDLDRWISLAEAARFSPYSAEYLSLRARTGKLAARKIGDLWYTTRANVEDYIVRQFRLAQLQETDDQRYHAFVPRALRIDAPIDMRRSGGGLLGSITALTVPADFTTSRVAAFRFGLHREYVAHLCRQGKVRGILLGRRWFVDGASLAAYVAARRLPSHKT